MYKKIIWPSLVVLSMTLTVIFMIGFTRAITISNGSGSKSDVDSVGVTGLEQESNESEATSSKVPNILVMGDSIGYGFGDEDNLDIGKRYASLVDPEGVEEIQVTNISVSGTEVAELKNLINQNEYVPIISEVTMIILSIGGNDLNRLQFQESSTVEIDYEETLKAYKDDLQSIIARIRDINPNAQIALVGLYDPYNNEDPQKTRLLLNWNYETRLIVYEDSKMFYIPTYELFQYHLDTYLAFDQFHPSSEGYKAITEVLYRILNGMD